MSLTEREEYREIAQEVLRDILPKELEQFVKKQEERAGHASLMERMVRVEEALLSQGKVLESLQREMDKRFESVYNRFETLDKRFEALQREMDKRFETLQREMDKRFEVLQREMDNRFESMEKRFETMDKRFSTVLWTIGLGFSLVMGFMALLKFAFA
jgi:exonuclease VII large subunit